MINSASYRKSSSGEWVVFGPATIVKPGPVSVVKKDGSRKTETVARVGKPFPVDGVKCVYGYLAEAEEFGYATRRVESDRSDRQQAPAGSRRPSRYAGRRECGECGEFVTPGTTCWETGMTH